MAKIKSEKVYINSKDGRKLQYTREIHVDSSGHFKILTDEELFTKIKEENIKHKSTRGSEPKYYFTGYTLGEVEKTEKEAIKLWRECEVETTLYILYRADSNHCLYNNNGKFELYYERSSNAILCEGSQHSMFFKRTSMDLEVKILKYSKYTSEGYENETYEAVNIKDIPEENIYSRKLYNANTVSSSYDHVPSNSFKRLPLNEVNAKFFYDMLLGMSIIAHNMRTFINGNPEHLESMITNRQTNLLEFNDKNTFPELVK